MFNAINLLLWESVQDVMGQKQINALNVVEQEVLLWNAQTVMVPGQEVLEVIASNVEEVVTQKRHATYVMVREK